MNKLFLILIISTLFSTACYNYDGPTRAKRKIVAPKPYVIPIKKHMSAQEYLEKMAGEISKKLPTAQVQILEDSVKVLFPDNIIYGPSAILPMENISPDIKKLASLIRKYNKTQVLVTGHTDTDGEERLNKEISEKRAQYIVDLLNAYNVSRDRLSSWGLGSSSPLADPNKIDRRVEFVILSTIEEEEDI